MCMGRVPCKGLVPHAEFSFFSSHGFDVLSMSFQYKSAELFINRDESQHITALQ